MRNSFVSGLIGAAALASIAFAQPSSAAIVYSNNFTNSSCSFSCLLTSSGSVLTAPNGQVYLGNLGLGASATLTITGLNTNKAHTGITVGFTLDVVGSMDGTGPVINGQGSGDYFNIGYSGSGTGTPFSYAFANYGGGNTQNYTTAGSAPGTGAATINALGYTGFPDSGNGIQDSEYNFTNNGLGALGPIAFADSGDSLTITFTGLSNEALNNEFYGIDNIVVQTTGVTNLPINAPVGDVPEPAPLLLMGIGLAAFIAEKRRRR